MHVLGISAFYHDSAACMVKDGELIAAAQEERFTRLKHDQKFPSNAINYCIKESNIASSEIDYIVFYDKPFLKFERLIETYLAFAPRGFKSFSASMPSWIKDKLFQKSNIIKEINNLLGQKEDWGKKLLFSEHHLSHAASAFFPSPFQEAAVLTMDGVGEWTTTSVSIGIGNKLEVCKEIHFPHSLGLLYSAFTYYVGFKVNSGEYKLMGLAPYGKPKYVNEIKDHLINIHDDGSFQLNMKYFNYCTGLTMTNEHFNDLFNGQPRASESEITQREMDLAASIQQVTEEVVIKLAKNIAKETGQKNLCLAGGVALNCVANGILLRENIFERIWIQPAAGDAGGALGAALGVYHMMLNGPRSADSSSDKMKGSYLGPKFSDEDINEQLTTLGAKYSEHSEQEIIELTANLLAEGKAVGWMNGRMEFGPRALGARSILADPRSPSMQKILNLKIKYRESFRPFAPSIIIEDLTKWFDIKDASPYMLLVANVLDKHHLKDFDAEKLFGIEQLNIIRSSIPAVTHIDYSARIQTVHLETNPRFYKLINRFKELTGCPILVNTSFNVRGEPIVCSPTDAFKCFMGTDLDALIAGTRYLLKIDQDANLKKDYKTKYKLD